MARGRIPHQIKCTGLFYSLEYGERKGRSLIVRVKRHWPQWHFEAWVVILRLISASWYGVKMSLPCWAWLVRCSGSNCIRAASASLQTTWLQQHLSAWVWSVFPPSTSSSSSSLAGLTLSSRLPLNSEFNRSSCLSLSSCRKGNEISASIASVLFRRAHKLLFPCFLLHFCFLLFFIPVGLL